MAERVSFNCPVPELENEMTLLEIKENIEEDMKTICTSINAKLNNLFSEPAQTNLDPTFFTEKRNSILKFLNKDLEIDLLNNTEIYIEFYNTLEKHNQQLEEAVKFISQEVFEETEELEETKHALKYIKDDLFEEDPDDPSPLMLDLKQINGKINVKFAELKKDLHFVLDSLFSESMRSIVQRLTAAYFKGGAERYIEIEDDDSTSAMSVLKNAALIVADPYNNLRIKFQDIVM